MFFVYVMYLCVMNTCKTHKTYLQDTELFTVYLIFSTIFCYPLISYKLLTLSTCSYLLIFHLQTSRMTTLFGPQLFIDTQAQHLPVLCQAVEGAIRLDMHTHCQEPLTEDHYTSICLRRNTVANAVTQIRVIPS